METLVDVIDDEPNEAEPLFIWEPHEDNKPQQLAYKMATQVDVLGYGGEGGGGKTDLMLGIAGTLAKRSMLFRREFVQLDSIITRGDEIYPVPYVSGLKRSWRFKGRIVTLAHMQRKDDWKKYKGRGLDFIGFDETSEFLEDQVRSMFGWARSSDPDQHVLIGFFFNPPTNADGRWLKQWFAPWVDPAYKGMRAAPGEIRWFAPDPDNEDNFIEVPDDQPILVNGVEEYPHSRTFIPASRHDNPYIGQAYERSLNVLPKTIRDAVRDASWEAGEEDDDWQLIPSEWVYAAIERGKNEVQPEQMTGLGLDVARGGKDRTCAAPLYGHYFGKVETIPGSSSKTGFKSAAVAIKLVGKNKSIPINVDSIGVGASTYDVLQGQGYNVQEVDVRTKSYAMDVNGIYHFVNLRAQIAWQLREALHPVTGDNICLPDDPELVSDLITPLWKLTPRGIQVEAKDDIKKRLKRSTDKGDAVMLAWYTLQNADEPSRPMDEVLGGF